MKLIQKDTATRSKDTLKLYWEQIRKHKITFSLMVICIPGASILLDTITPYFLSQAVGAFPTGDNALMWSFLKLAAITSFSAVLLNLLGFQSAIWHESHVRRKLAYFSMSRLLAKDISFFANQKIGSLTGKYIDFINAHVGLQDMIVIRTATFVFNVLIGIVLIWRQTPLLAGIVLLLIVLLLVQVKLSRLLRMKLRIQRKELIAESNGTSADIISNYATVKAFAGEATELANIDKVNEHYRVAYLKDFRWMSAEGTSRILVMQAAQIIAVAVIANLLSSGTLQLGIAIFTIAYMQRLATQLFTLGELLFGYDRIMLQAAPMTDILLEQPLIINSSDRPLLATEGNITFQEVNYAYEDAQNTPILKDFSLAIPAMQKVGIVGHSGAGKTTLTKLLLRFDDVNGGQILIDGQAIANVTLESLRQSIAYVPQEPALFHRSLRENIAYGRQDASEQEILEAARQAYAYDFIIALPKGLDTIVGERGIKLSGGQRQRVAIARAFLKDAPILVLDEATSSLDSESEALIQKALSQLMAKRTSLVIAHRLSTISKLDRIVVMDGGRIVEDGSHSELLSQNGIYARLWRHQSGGFIDE